MFRSVLVPVLWSSFSADVGQDTRPQNIAQPGVSVDVGH